MLYFPIYGILHTIIQIIIRIHPRVQNTIVIPIYASLQGPVHPVCGPRKTRSRLTAAVLVPNSGQ